MDIGFDRKSGRLSSAESASGGQTGRADWHGLRLRLAAAYAARPLLAGDHSDEDAANGGSFDWRSARLLAAYGNGPAGGLGGVNPTALGNGKSNYDNDAVVAGATMTGD